MAEKLKMIIQVEEKMCERPNGTEPGQKCGLYAQLGLEAMDTWGRGQKIKWVGHSFIHPKFIDIIMYQ